MTIYSVAYPKARAQEARIRAFCDWIFDEVDAAGSLPAKEKAVAN